METLRQHRILQMKQHALKKQEWLKRGHGEYRDIQSEKEFFSECKTEERLICHFHRNNWPCKVNLWIWSRPKIHTYRVHLHYRKTSGLKRMIAESNDVPFWSKRGCRPCKMTSSMLKMTSGRCSQRYNSLSSTAHISHNTSVRQQTFRSMDVAPSHACKQLMKTAETPKSKQRSFSHISHTTRPLDQRQMPCMSLHQQGQNTCSLPWRFQFD